MCKAGKLLVLMAAFLVVAAIAQAQAPTTQMYQGRLTDASLEPIVVPTEVTFRIFDAADESGVELWAEEQTVTPNEVGVFTVELGAITPFPANLFDGSVKYLSMTVTGDDEMLPRQPMTSVPYSMATSAPGFANSYMQYCIVEEPFPVAFDTLEVVAPGPGYLVVEADGFMYLYKTDIAISGYTYVTVDTLADETDFRAYSYGSIQISAPTGYHSFPFSVTRVVPVSQADTYTFYLNSCRTSTISFAWLYSTNLKAVYYPTHIGTEIPIPHNTSAAGAGLPGLLPHELQQQMEGTGQPTD